MTRSRISVLLAVLTAATALAGLGRAAPARAETLALLPVQDRAGDSAVVQAVATVLGEELEGRYEMLDPEEVRDALRRRRIRSLDDTAPAELRELAAEVGAAHFLSVVVHLVERETTPRVALSARRYDAVSGEVGWAGFESGSGLDGRRLLGLGVVDDAEILAERLVRRLVGDLAHRDERSPATAAGLPALGVSGLGTVALVPLSGLAEADATRAAETATEIVRAALGRRGVQVLSPNRTFEALYVHRGDEPLGGWGAVDEATRRALREAGADLILTGSVERWEHAGDGFEPEPVIAVALRVLDSAGGRIVWTGALDRRGWDRETVFRLGRIWDHGTLAARMIERLTEGMTRELAASRAADASRGTTP